MSDRMRLAILFHRVGPYHLARIKAARTRMDVRVIQYVEQDSVYQWDLLDRNARREFRTIFRTDQEWIRNRRVSRLRMGEALEEYRPDVVAVPGWGDSLSLSALEWCLRAKVPSILMSESQRGDRSRSQLGERIKGFLVRGFGAALVGGGSNADYLLSLGFPPARVFSGYDAIDNDHFKVAKQYAWAGVEALRPSFPLPDRYILAVSRFIPIKNLAAVIRGYGELCRSGQDDGWDLVLAGDGPCIGELRGLTQNLGLESRIHFPGFVQYEELPRFYANAGLFVHIPMIEPWGLVINEALAASLPVIVSKACGAAAELVRDGENGFVIESCDGESVTDRMSKLIRNPGKRREMGQRGFERVAQYGPAAFGDGIWRSAEASLGNRHCGSQMVRRLIARLLALRSPQ